MANQFDELYSMIAKVIKNETRFNVPRMGIISDILDPLKKGRVLVQIQSLGWDTNDKAAWCYAKDKKGIITPNKDDYVIVEFIDGNMNLPVYSGMASQMKNMLPSGYDGTNTTQVLFENRNKDFSIIYDENQEIVNIGSGDESYVKGNIFRPELQKNIDALTQLQIDFASWVPVAGDGGLALKTLLTSGFLTKALAVLTNILSDRIKGE